MSIAKPVDEIVNGHFPANAEVRVVSLVGTAIFPVVVPWAGVDFFDQSEKTAREVLRPAVEKVAANSVRATRAAN